MSRSEREEAVEEGIEALGIPKQTYHVLLRATARVFAEEDFEAVDDEAARKYAEALDPREFRYSYDSDDGIEGDEVVFLSGYDDAGDETMPEAELVLKKDGEPFSWTACNIVEDLAKLADTTYDMDAIAELINRAKASLTK
jgi:hypothetical protein